MEKKLGLINLWDLFLALNILLFDSKGKSQLLLMSTFKLKICACICRSIKPMLNSKEAFEMPTSLTYLKQPTTAWTEEGSSMSSFFTDEELSEKRCLHKHSFADCLHPCRVQVRGLRIWGGQRQWWVNESFLAILEVILNKATLMWEVERIWWCLFVLAAWALKMRTSREWPESRFSRPILAWVSITRWEAANVSHTGLSPICEQAALCFLKYHF